MDMDSYIKGQLDMCQYLYERLQKEPADNIIDYLRQVYNSTESRCRRDEA